MAVQTGRTSGVYTDFRIHDSGGTMRSIPVSSISGLGAAYDEMDVTALQDAAKNMVKGHPDVPISITGPFDTSAAATAGTLSGSHTVLAPLLPLNTALSLDVQVGIRHAWEAGEPQFGITASGNDGYVLTSYIPDIAAGTYSAEFRLVGGGTLPAWGTAAES